MTPRRDIDVVAVGCSAQPDPGTVPATVACYARYAFVINGHARTPIRFWFNALTDESLVHAREAGDLIVHLATGRTWASRPCRRSTTTRSTPF